MPTNPIPTQQETLRDEAVRLCLAMGLPDNHACIRLAENYLNARAADAGPRGDAACEWEDNGNGLWLTSCGDTYKVHASDINVTGIRFCCFCGNRVEPIEFNPSSDGPRPRAATLSESEQKFFTQAEATFRKQSLIAIQQLTKARSFAAHTEEAGEVCTVSCEGCNDPVGQIIREVRPATPVIGKQQRKVARRIIDAVINSPCVVEVRMFSQPEAVEKLEDAVIALLPTATSSPAPAESVCAKCGGSGEIEIGCAMDHALTAPCVECRGTGTVTTAPAESTRRRGTSDTC